MNTTLTTTMTANGAAALSIYDEGVFDKLAKISEIMAAGSLIPDTLKADKTGAFPIEKVRANCFLIAEQSLRWGMSPFAVAQHASVVYGRLMWEGKLVAGVIEQQIGIRLTYTYDGAGEGRRVTVSGKYPDEIEPRTISGTVAEWKTSQWDAKAYDQRLAYRGAREWARRHAPGVMLGIVTDDEGPDIDPRPEMRDATPERAKRNAFADKLPAPAAEAAKAPAAPPSPASGGVTPPATPTAQTAKRDPNDPIKATVVSATQNGAEWLVVLGGSKGQIACRAATHEIGVDAEFLVGGNALVTLRKEREGFLITSIQHQPEEEEEEGLV
jgi:hypothetical protein